MVRRPSSTAIPVGPPTPGAEGPSRRPPPVTTPCGPAVSPSGKSDDPDDKDGAKDGEKEKGKEKDQGGDGGNGGDAEGGQDAGER